MALAAPQGPMSGPRGIAIATYNIGAKNEQMFAGRDDFEAKLEADLNVFLVACRVKSVWS